MKKLLSLLLLLSILLSGCAVLRKNTEDPDTTLETVKFANELDGIIKNLDSLEVGIDDMNDDELIQP